MYRPVLFRHCLRELAGFMVWIAIKFPCHNLQIEHASQAPHWRKQVDLQRLGDKIFAPKKANPSTTDPIPQKFQSDVLPSTTVAKTMCIFPIRMSFHSLKVLDLDGCFSS